MLTRAKVVVSEMNLDRSSISLRVFRSMYVVTSSFLAKALSKVFLRVIPAIMSQLCRLGDHYQSHRITDRKYFQEPYSRRLDTSSVPCCTHCA